MGTLTLLVNGRVLTMNRARPLAEALAIRDGRIVALGSSEEVLRLREPDSRLLDLTGHTALPGFIDPHNHFAITALEGFWADCRTPPLRSIAEIQARLREAAANCPPGAWVRGWGYHHVHLAERRHPTRHDLDDAVADRPAILMHFSHHQCVANSLALAAAGITRTTPDPPGGEIARGKGGEPTGLLFERAMGLPEAKSREGWEERFVEAAGANSRRYAEAGITTVEDAAVSPAMARRYLAAAEAGRLGIRVQMMAVGSGGWFDPPIDRARERPWQVAGPNLLPGALKIFVDGGYRCAMRLSKEGRAVTSGFLFYARGELADLLVAAWRHGWRVTCHAIGNLGVETCVEAVEDALRREPAGEGRVRLDHAMFLTRELILRIKALGIWLVSQPSFVYDLGPGAPPGAGILRLPFRTIQEAGVPLAFSSDFPCGTLAPLTLIYSAVTRRTAGGEVSDPDEAISPEAALEAYTIGVARAAGLERECGSIEVGKSADLVVLDRNPLEVPSEELLRLSVVKTLVAGQEVWP
jgi:predicted amidohydrolase YtcJ